MQELMTLGLARLAGESSQAIFHLKQAMGGGKTHLLVGFGLLAMHPELRKTHASGIAAARPLRHGRRRSLQRAKQPGALLLGRDRRAARQGRAVRVLLDRRAQGAGRERLDQAVRRRPTGPDPARRDAAVLPLPRHPEGRERHGRGHRHPRVRQPAHGGRQEEERLRRRFRPHGGVRHRRQADRQGPR